MELSWQPIEEGNRDLALTLAVSSAQVGTVEPVADCLREAAELALWRPVLLLADGEAVGFAMYGLWENEGSDGRLWLDRFFIDRRHQGRGLAKAVLPALIAHLRATYGRSTVYLSVYPNNAPAIRLYEALGFCYNGELDCNGERVMVLE